MEKAVKKQKEECDMTVLKLQEWITKLKHLKNICVKLDLTECRCGNLKDTVDLGLMDKSANSILIMAEFENIVF